MPAPASESSAAPLEERMAALSREHDGHPLLEELRSLSDRFLRLERKLNKITRMSDRAQAEVLELNRILNERAITDPLTGLLNRAGFFGRVEAERDRLARKGITFGLLMIDLDHFKSINDQYGHATGDGVLVAVARALRGGTRPGDSCVRWGGEEFIVVLADVDAAALARVAGTLLQQIRALDAGQNFLAGRVGASIGACLVESPEPIDDSIRKADDAVYEAKRAGRGRVVVHGASR